MFQQSLFVGIGNHGSGILGVITTMPSEPTTKGIPRLTMLMRLGAQRLGINHHPKLRRSYNALVRVLVQTKLKYLNVPIIAVTGTNGKTTTTRMIERILRDAGYRVGAGTTEGATHNGRMVWDGDAGGMHGALKASTCPNVDVLVLETARGGIIKHGIAYRHCHVGIVTNVHEDHMGLDGIDTVEQMAEVKASVARRVKTTGTLVLNADNRYTRRMGNNTGASVIFFTTGSDDPRRQSLYFLRNHGIYRRINQAVTHLMDARDVPITLNGLVSYNVENVLAALACMEGIQSRLPIDQERIKHSLMNFGFDPEDNFNRFILLSFGQDKVILTRSKNPESCRRDMQIVQQLRQEGQFDHVIGIMSGIGNRQVRFHEEMSAIAAATCDHFFIRPPKSEYLRGKTNEEIIQLVASRISRKKIISYRQCGLSEVIAMAREQLSGRILFVVLNIYIEASIQFREAVKAADAVNQLSSG